METILVQQIRNYLQMVLLDSFFHALESKQFLVLNSTSHIITTSIFDSI